MSDIRLAADTLFDELFDNAKREIFRLELSPEYRVEFESEDLKCFKKHGVLPPPDGFMQKWFERLRNNKARGVKYWRVRRLSRPQTVYEKFELASFRQQAPHGIKIYAFNRSSDFSKMKELELAPYGMEFWMFDEERVLLVQYDLLGKYMAMWEYLGDPKPYVKLKNALKKVSKLII